MPYRASLPPSVQVVLFHSLSFTPLRPTVAAGLRAARAGIDTEGGSPKIEEREERGRGESQEKKEGGKGKEGVPRGGRGRKCGMRKSQEGLRRKGEKGRQREVPSLRGRRGRKGEG